MNKVFQALAANQNWLVLAFPEKFPNASLEYVWTLSEDLEPDDEVELGFIQLFYNAPMNYGRSIGITGEGLIYTFLWDKPDAC